MDPVKIRSGPSKAPTLNSCDPLLSRLLPMQKNTFVHDYFLKQDSSKYTRSKNASILVGTYNVNGRPPTDNLPLESWLGVWSGAWMTRQPSDPKRKASCDSNPVVPDPAEVYYDVVADVDFVDGPRTRPDVSTASTFPSPSGAAGPRSSASTRVNPESVPSAWSASSLRVGDAGIPDLIAVSLQEVVPLTAASLFLGSSAANAAKWDGELAKYLNGRDWAVRQGYIPAQAPSPFRAPTARPSGLSPYVQIVWRQMVGISLSVWVNQAIVSSIRGVQTTVVPTGFGGRFGNKGAVVARMRLYDSSLVFVSAHLSSGEADGDELRRNADAAEILRRCQFPEDDGIYSAGGAPMGNSNAALMCASLGSGHWPSSALLATAAERSDSDNDNDSSGGGSGGLNGGDGDDVREGEGKREDNGVGVGFPASDRAGLTLLRGRAPESDPDSSNALPKAPTTSSASSASTSSLSSVSEDASAAAPKLDAVALDHGMAIWAGDLNYRLAAVSDRAVFKAIRSGDLESILPTDQLHRETAAGRAFRGWREGCIAFPPTYKFVVGTNAYAGEECAPAEAASDGADGARPERRSKGRAAAPKKTREGGEVKKRSPAWCDRILWFSGSGSGSGFGSELSLSSKKEDEEAVVKAGGAAQEQWYDASAGDADASTREACADPMTMAMVSETTTSTTLPSPNSAGASGVTMAAGPCPEKNDTGALMDGRTVVQQGYWSGTEMTLSDHKPVASSFLMACRSYDRGAVAALVNEAHRAADAAEEARRPRCSLAGAPLDFGEVLAGRTAAAELRLFNHGGSPADWLWITDPDLDLNLPLDIPDPDAAAPPRRQFPGQGRAAPVQLLPWLSALPASGRVLPGETQVIRLEARANGEVAVDGCLELAAPAAVAATAAAIADIADTRLVELVDHILILRVPQCGDTFVSVMGRLVHGCIKSQDSRVREETQSPDPVLNEWRRHTWDDPGASYE